MALAHKGLTPEYKPVRVSDKAAIAFSKQEKVPILVDGEETMHNFFRIAQHLEARYPDKPLFGGEIGQSLSRFINSWVDRTIVPRLVPLLVIDVLGIIDEGDGQHCAAPSRRRSAGRWKNSRQTATRKSPPSVGCSIRRAPRCARSHSSPDRSRPTRTTSCSARCNGRASSSPAELLEPDDALVAWRERMLDLHGGLARTMPARA